MAMGINNPDAQESPVWISGSSQLLLDHRIKESLAGRVSYYNLHPSSMAVGQYEPR